MSLLIVSVLGVSAGFLLRSLLSAAIDRHSSSQECPACFSTLRVHHGTGQLRLLSPSPRKSSGGSS